MDEVGLDSFRRNYGSIPSRENTSSTNNNNRGPKSTVEGVTDALQNVTFVYGKSGSINILATNSEWDLETADLSLYEVTAKLIGQPSSFPEHLTTTLTLSKPFPSVVTQCSKETQESTKYYATHFENNYSPEVTTTNCPLAEFAVSSPQQDANRGKRKRHFSGDSTGRRQESGSCRVSNDSDAILKFPVVELGSCFSSLEPADYVVEEDTPSSSESPADHRQKPETSSKISERNPVKYSDNTECSRLHKIFEFYPVVSVLNNDKIKSHCSFCFRRLRNHRTVCLSCDFCWFCNETCKSVYYDTHKHECNLLSNKEFRPSAFVRALAHLHWKLQEPSLLGSSTYAEDLTNKILGLRSYEQDLLFSETYQKSIVKQLDLLEKFFQHKTSISYDYFTTLYAKFLKHSMVITNIHGSYMGIGMYLGLADFEHSCLPNTNIVFLGNMMQVIAKNCIAIDEPVKISFIDVINPKKKRLEALIPINGGICDCYLCQDDEFEEMICSIEGNISESDIPGLTEAAQLLKAGRYPEEPMEKYFSRLAGELGYLNHYHIKLLALAAESCKKMKMSEEAACCYNDLMKIYEIILGEHNARTIAVTFQLGRIFSRLKDRSKAVTYFRKAVAAALEAYGQNHQYTRTIQKMQYLYDEEFDLYIR